MGKILLCWFSPVGYPAPLRFGDFVREDTDSPLCLITNHLGATSLVIDTSGQEVAKRSYLPYGETWGVSANELPTDYTFTGQREAAKIGLKFYVARWYDSEIGHFLQSDTIVPDGSTMGWNRYIYVKYNPLLYTDPSGHWASKKQFVEVMLNTLNQGSVVHKPKITPREEWGALDPGPQILYAYGPNGVVPFLVGGNYDGNDLLSDLYPGKTLPDIYDTITIHHEGNSATNSPFSVQFDTMVDGAWDIPYNFIIGPDGTIYEGRTLSRRGAHIEGHNSGNIGILVLGDYQPGYQVGSLNLPFDISESNITPAQVASLTDLVIYLDAEYGIDQVVGHNDLNSTVCPGEKLYPFVDMLNNLINIQR